jgi:S-adenosylmethionine synthetase
MIGYACRDNKAMIPQELYLARDLCKFIYEKYPEDGKTQITLNKQNEIVTVIASFCNVNAYDLKDLVNLWIESGVSKEANGNKIFINPAGDWSHGGFDADTGLTGRKLAVDNYGPQIPIGGGCFSGKDATKVDRSAAYMARWVAVKLLKFVYPQSKEVIVKLAYSIGVAEPVMATAEIDGKEIDLIDSGYGLTPKEIIDNLELRKPQFQKTAEWGHFGNGFKWDK